MNKKIVNFKISKQNEVFAFFELVNQSSDIKEKLFSFADFKEDQIKENFVALFIDQLYMKEESLMRDEIEKIEKNWYNNQSFFITQSKNIFKDIDIFLGGVTAIPSVWPFYGRFFEKQLITKQNPVSNEEVVMKVNRLLKGWQQYYNNIGMGRTRNKINRFAELRVMKMISKRNKKSRILWKLFKDNAIYTKYGLYKMESLKRIFA